MNSLILISMLTTFPAQTEGLLPWKYESLAENVSVTLLNETIGRKLLVQADVKRGANPCEASHGKTKFESRVEGEYVILTPVKLLNPMIRQTCPLYYAPIFERTSTEISEIADASMLVIENYKARGENKQIVLFSLTNEEGGVEK